MEGEGLWLSNADAHSIGKEQTSLVVVKACGNILDGDDGWFVQFGGVERVGERESSVRAQVAFARLRPEPVQCLTS